MNSGGSPETAELSGVNGIEPIHASGNQIGRNSSIAIQKLIRLMGEVHRLRSIVDVGTESNPDGAICPLNENSSVPRIRVCRVVHKDLSLGDIKRPLRCGRHSAVPDELRV